LDRPRELAAYIAIVLEERPRRPQAARVLHEPIFHPAVVRASWPVPRIDTVGELADRLELDPGQLAWLADVRGLERTASSKLRNYTYVRLPRANGPPRVIERPKARLKESSDGFWARCWCGSRCMTRRMGSCAGARRGRMRARTSGGAW
jgi:hypothetical protein